LDVAKTSNNLIYKMLKQDHSLFLFYRA